MLPSCFSRRSSAVRDFPCPPLLPPSRISLASEDLPPCQKRTCTFVSFAMHTLQRMQSESNERARAFLPGVRDAPSRNS